MGEQESYDLNNQEKLIILNKKDQPLSPEQVDDLEGPLDNDVPLQLPDFNIVKKELLARGFEVIGEREPCSGGSFGPLFKIKIRDQKNGEEKYIIERTYTEVKDIERRFLMVENIKEESVDSEPRYKIISEQEQVEGKLVIDYLYNEEKALKVLQDLKGIPRFYGAVYDDLMGSTLEEFIDGYDLNLVLMNKEGVSQERLVNILNKVKTIYIEAANLGYIHGDPGGSTIMIDKNTDEPYLADWYLYSYGSIENDSEIKKRYLEGLEKISWLQQRILAESN